MSVTISASSYGAGTASSTMGSGIDVSTTVDALLSTARKPENVWLSEITANLNQIALLGSFNSMLTSLYNDMNQLKDPISGVFSAVDATSSNTGLVTATATSSATIGTHTVQVNKLAQTATMYSTPTAANTTLDAGSYVITVNGTAQTVTIDSSNNTLSGFVSAINAAKIGVTASLVTQSSGVSISLVSNTSGSSGDFKVTSAPSQLTFNSGIKAQDAEVVIDGQTMTFGSNTVSGAVTGVTFNLWSTSDSAAIVKIAADTSTAVSGITNFVNDYNTIITAINAQYTVDSSGHEGILAGDAALMLLQSQMLGMISYTTGSGTYQTLRSIGITMADTGLLTADSTALGDALAGNYSAVQDFFQKTDVGFAAVESSAMFNLTSPTTGVLNVDINGLKSSNTDFKKSIDNFESRMSALSERLTAMYVSINTELQLFPSTVSSVTAQLNSLSSKSNG